MKNSNIAKNMHQSVRVASPTAVALLETRLLFACLCVRAVLFHSNISSLNFDLLLFCFDRIENFHAYKSAIEVLTLNCNAVYFVVVAQQFRWRQRVRASIIYSE